MGLRYLLFRLKHEFLRRSGMLVRNYPVNPGEIPSPSLSEAILALKAWPWQGRDSFSAPPAADAALEEEMKELLSLQIRLFQTIPFQLQSRDDWHRHPQTGFVYDKTKHWTQIPDMSPEAGDIKFVWERARFTQLQTIMRYDLSHGEDHAAWVFSEIESWINENPINCGPHYRCSQEISLRVMNWLGAISFYRNSPELHEPRWQKIWPHLYWQVHHVRQNIDFSRIAVRNNHAITETLMLYIFGSLFPEMPDCREWRDSGKRWFEEEILYQVYPDGSYLQFSMNYQRVVVQLLTLAIRFAEKAGDSWSQPVMERAAGTLSFMEFFQDPVSGCLPNYGANDGALFFRFSSKGFRDYRPQLEALASALGRKGNPDFQDAAWFGFSSKLTGNTSPAQPGNGYRVFSDGGFAGIRTDETLLFFRSGRHRDRPSQADNHHFDLWYKGQNILRDAGTYKYNADPADIRFFFGTASHNTLMIDGCDQMLKGPRFVWLNWSQSTGLEGFKSGSDIILKGTIAAFRHLSDGIFHTRSIRQVEGKPEWLVEDFVEGKGERELELLWHPGPGFFPDFTMEVKDENGNLIPVERKEGWFSGNYGQKEAAPYFSFKTKSASITTHIFKTEKA